jgi:hypothetical protein
MVRHSTTQIVLVFKFYMCCSVYVCEIERVRNSQVKNMRNDIIRNVLSFTILAWLLVMGFPNLIPFVFRTPQSIWKVITIFTRKKTATFTRKIQTQEPIEVEMVNLQKSKSYSYLESAFSPWRILRVCSWQPNRTLRDCENKESVMLSEERWKQKKKQRPTEEETSWPHGAQRGDCRSIYIGRLLSLNCSLRLSLHVQLHVHSNSSLNLIIIYPKFNKKKN